MDYLDYLGLYLNPLESIIMQWRLVAVLATLIPILVIAAQFDVKPEDLLAIGVVPFLASVLIMMAKLGLQGLKLAYIVRSYAPGAASVIKISGVRVGAEFIKLSTPMFIGAEFIVIYYLHKRNVHPSKSAWIALVDIVTEVLAAGILAVLAAVLAMAAGSYIVGAVVLAVSIPITAIWSVLFFLSSRMTFTMPRSMRVLATRLAGERGAHYMDEGDKWLLGICRTSRENAGSSRANRIFVVSLLMSLGSWTLYGLSFLIIAIGIGYAIMPLDSVMAVMAANSVANLPITVGGAGLTELGIFAYINDANPFDISISEGVIEWNAILGWRIATYYIPLAVTWLLLVKLALTKVSRSDVQ